MRLLLEDKDPQRWYWWGLAAARGSASGFKFGSVVDRFNYTPSLAPAVFMIGRMLKAHIDSERKTIFGNPFDYDSCIGSANRAVAFFFFQCAATRAAVDT